ncbi:metalloprotease JAMM1, desampylating [Halalkaliarchaeum desulfuricum]|uniref:Metalloprotease JAMM1, desampylating n=1 Tax=Halalkaliarchaeum desulfuricum TaxID=2055893 RepID=A0A343TIT8_9EURY|nr:desampylase [Halalkaliarchaeum desulfuricum]AUX09010.1 metalloprotease JAMM1, desampylating [Halalkaliarchaeum desulfuricum]
MPAFTRSAYDEIVSRARRGGAREICGVLAGTTKAGEPEPIVDSVYPVDNVADAPRSRYELDPEGQLRAIETLEERGETLVGFYHSHPRGPPTPSETDVDSATWPGASYVIVALDGEPYVGSWLWDDDTFEQQLVRVVPDGRNR